MGRKQIFQRYKNIFYFTAGLIIIGLFTGCQYQYYPKLSIETVEGQEGREHLKKVKMHVEKQDFKAAFEENKKAYDLSPLSLKQEAIFQKGLLYAHPENPDKNYEKAMVCFDLIDKKQNNTVLENNSAFILSILKEAAALEQKTSSSSQKILTNKKRLDKGKKQIEDCNKEQQKLKNDILKLEQQIKQLKEIDLNSNKGVQGAVK